MKATRIGFYGLRSGAALRHIAWMDGEDEAVGAYNFVKVSAGIATSGVVPAAGFEAIGRGGYRAVINLLPADSKYAVADEGALVREHGMSYVHIPVDFSAPTLEDFEAFCQAMDAHAGDKVWVHCAANYRVSCFLSLYGERRLGWTQSQSRALISKVWEPDEIWQAFATRIRGVAQR